MLQKSLEMKEKDKKVFLDTSVILSYVFEDDEYHKEAVSFLQHYTQIYYVSPMAVFEVYCVVPRRYGGVRLPRMLHALLNQFKTKEERIACISTLVLFYLNSSLSKVIFCSDEQFGWKLKDHTVDDSKMKIFEPYYLAVRKGHKLKLSAADMLHLAYASKVAQAVTVHFVTFDGELIERAKIIKQEINVKVVKPQL